VNVAAASTPPPPVGPPVSAPYSPAQIRHAYGVDQLSQTGAGQTIAIIDAFDDPTIANDLAAFDQLFNLPAANLIKATPQGTPSYDSGWSTEIALDVEWAHAMAPGATILLVEAKSASLSNLLSAVDYAVANGANQISMSFGGTEFPTELSSDSHFNHPGVSFFASAGDSAGQVLYPATSPYVTAVGGTSISLDAAGNRISEVAWSDSGGGLSNYETRPSYQAGFNPGSNRGTPDVASDAAPGTGLYVYGSSGLFQVGGTSAGAPVWAGLAALVNQGRAAAGRSPIGTGHTYGLNDVLYALAGTSAYATDFFDVTAGSNGNAAKTGYDLVTGLGSPVANRLVPDLIQAS
jgi:subtilase family serine protease